MYTITFTKYITHSVIFFTTHEIINITHNCSVQINTHKTIYIFIYMNENITFYYRYYITVIKYLECTRYCNIFTVFYTYILKKQFYDQNFITHSNVRHLFSQSDW